MRANRSSRIPSVLAGLCLAAALGSTAPGSAAPVVKYKCVGTIHYHGTAFTYFYTTLWHWSFDSHGKCVAGALRQVTYDVQGSSMPKCSGPSGTSSWKSPYGTYLASTTLTNEFGESSVALQQWVGIQQLQINARMSVPSRYIPIGGIVGYGTVPSLKKPIGTWEEPTVSGRVAFAFGSEEIPNTDQPDGQAC